jgi:hypothetical protein
MMPVPQRDASVGKKYRLKTSTPSINSADGSPTILRIPSGAVVEVFWPVTNGEVMTRVVWRRRSLSVFTQDLEERAVPVEPDLP